MNVKRLLPVLLMLYLIGGSGEALANSDQSTRTDCDGSVAACVQQNGDQSKTARTNSEAPPLKTESNSSTVTTTVKVIFALIFVVGLMIVVLKLLHKRTQIFQQGKGIQTLGGAMLGNQRSVQMVKVGNRVLIVGVGDDVSLIKEIDDQQEMKELLSQYESGSSSIQMRASLFEWIKERLKSSSKQPGNSFQETLKQRLDEAKKGRTEIYEALKKEQNND
ncbi:flagellar biosynthetic protein FliO [Alkalihalobacillus sp. AL-G]|uniref:flagellar biosynthetic protein FliO n=1 Tax=Alkalihalobacillus sp. AL-G TaxID=2926399 RepID=UPI00272C8EA2|nr:flagellar biosynthetic protein FliO [Alkalihalobacillus sp. AL-G]WLD95165.1 flagellar biosynthetic protein FliO [Alkalihalobacillus sp. AL-G]